LAELDRFSEETLSVRRVITGEKPDGKSFFALDEHVPKTTFPWKAGAAYYRIWGLDRLPAELPNGGIPSCAPTRFPGTDGVRVEVYEYLPGATASFNLEDYAESAPDEHSEFMRLHGYGVEIQRNPATKLHKTDSIDIVMPLLGEVVLIQDNGAEVTLRVGDVLVQNGAMHTWENRTDERCLVGVVYLAAEREDD
jgi:hypothetical protein